MTFSLLGAHIRYSDMERSNKCHLKVNKKIVDSRQTHASPKIIHALVACAFSMIQPHVQH